MRVLIGQIPVAAGDVAANVAAVVGALEEHPEAELAAFPELALTGYDLAAATELAVPSGDAAFAPIVDAARRTSTAVVVGFAERAPTGIANAAACIDRDGRWAATYRKTYLFGAGERRTFHAGDELVVVELAGRRVAPLICFDLEFPEPARAVARAGAEVLVTVAANMAPYGPQHAVAMVARAQDNHLPHLYVNQAGEHGGLRFVGASAAVAPDGRVVGALPPHPAVSVCELPLGAPAPDTDYLRLLRPTPPVRNVTTAVLEGIAS